ncbi:hypothetical protein H0Z60_19505 [Ectothiorhodospiraceae bacterium WFHF3C12]|nr:hypothetical protein [Ectothiorhodospiraceae bacterium WFHF3C12]
MDPDLDPGRSCPLHYHYGPEVLDRLPVAEAQTLLVVGGLYGNVDALNAILARYEAECRAATGPVRLVFNGDAHWFDVDPDAFQAVNLALAEQDAIAGNVEAELAAASGAGCGCGYPEYVDAATVARSNEIMERLRAVARAVPGSRNQLGNLPMHAVFSVAGHRIGVIHGDPESLAGWAFAAESLAPPDTALRTALGCAQARQTSPELVRDYLRRANVSVFASTHTCLPVAQGYRWDGGAGAVINNGSAGMPNFSGDLRGLITRIGASPAPDALYGIELDGLHCQALPVAYDHRGWLRRFERWWPAGSPAHRSYHPRITRGPVYTASQADRGFVRV